MKAFTVRNYGPPQTAIKLEEMDVPKPEKDELLLKVHTTSINDWDWSMVRGKPNPYRLIFGLRKPKSPIPGVEMAGTIEEIGAEVETNLKKGDRVYGDISDYGWGTFAEYVCVKADTMRLMPASMTFEDATAIPHAALLAYQGIVDMGEIKQGQEILFNGAGGGVGTLGLQIAKANYGATVAGVDTGDKLQMMEELGFDEIIDYKKTDFTRSDKQYDIILDAKTNRAPGAYKRALKPEGRYVSVGGDTGKIIRLVLHSKFGGGKRFQMLPLKPNLGLEHISSLYEAGKLVPIIDGPYPFEEIPRLVQYFGDALHSGKVVVSVS